jgi:hypothetical protein
MEKPVLLGHIPNNCAIYRAIFEGVHIYGLRNEYISFRDIPTAHAGGTSMNGNEGAQHGARIEVVPWMTCYGVECVNCVCVNRRTRSYKETPSSWCLQGATSTGVRV